MNGNGLSGLLSGRLHIIWIVLGILLCSLGTQAQQYEPYLYGLEDGLPTYFTKDAVEDSAGYLYVATDHGLAMYNGVTFRRYQQELPSKFVKKVFLLENNQILVITDNGIVRAVRNEESLTFHPFPDHTTATDSLTYPKAVFRDHNGVFWISEPVSVVRYDASSGHFQRYRFPESDRSFSYFDSFFLFERDTSLYALTYPGNLYRFNPDADAFELLSSTNRVIGPVTDAKLSQQGSLLVASDDGLFEYLISGTSYDIEPLYTGSSVSAVAEKEPYRYLFSNAKDQVIQLDDRGHTHRIRPLFDSPVRGINGMTKGSDNTVWVTSDQGIMLVSRNLFNRVKLPGDNQFLSSLVRTLDGSLVATTSTHLMELTLDATTQDVRFRDTPILEGENVLYATKPLGSDSYFVSTQQGNLYHYRSGRYQTVEVPFKPNGVKTGIFRLSVDSKNQLWILREELPGVIRLDSTGQMTHFGADQGLTTQFLDMEPTSWGDLFFVGQSKNSYFYQYQASTNRFINLSLPLPDSIQQSSQPLNAFELTLSENGMAYILTAYGVMAYNLRDETMEIIPLPENFPARIVNSIQVNRDNEVWIGTERGLLLYSKRNFRQFYDSGQSPSLTVNYRSMVVDSAGNLWTGTYYNGLALLTEKRRMNRKTAKPRISKVMLGGKEVEDHEDIAMAEERTLEIYYHSVAYPKQLMKYQVRIPELSRRWGSFSSERVFKVNDLSPGEYTFEVRALKSGFEPSEITAVSLKVEPLWYRSVGAIAIYALLGLALLFLIYEFRKENIQKKWARERLRRAEFRLQTIISNTSIILFALNEEGYFTLCEGAGLEALGYESDFFMDKHYHQIYPEAIYRRKIRQVYNGEQVKYQRTLGDVTLSTRLKPLLNEQGEVKGIIGVSIDITDRVEIEHELLRAKNMAESANKAKSAFLANMSHELRTPLNAILGFAQVILKKDDLTSQNREQIEIMFRSGTHLLNMINDILDLSKIESGQLSVRSSTFEVSTLLDEVKYMFHQKLSDRGLKFEIIQSEDTPPLIKSDEQKIRQILINLIGNALKYTEEGKIKLTVDKRPNEPVLEMVVEDTGTGIPEEEQKRIFNAFQQAKTGYREGSGLGLSITKGLVESLNGTIHVVSEPGVGSQFTVSIPYSQPDAVDLKNFQSPEITTRSAKLASPITALLVDDVAENLSFLDLMMQELGFNTLLATSGKEALAQLEADSVDLIILDILMPGMDGKETLSRLRSNLNWRDLPAVALTASSFSNTRKELLRHGFDGFLHKPFKEHELISVLKEVLAPGLFLEVEESSGEQPGSVNAENVEDRARQTAAILRQTFDSTEVARITDALELMDTTELKAIIEPLNRDEQESLRYLVSAVQDDNYRFLLELNDLLQPSHQSE